MKVGAKRMSFQKFELFYPFLFLILLMIDVYNIFYEMGNLPIYSWDEARHGVSAYEMLKQGNFVVNTYQYKTDYWNLKPPLSFWAVMAGYKLAGFNPLGLRLFSGISSMLTIIMAAIFVQKSYGKLAALLSTLTLSSTTQFIINHCARTGDADALYIFLFTASILSLILSERNRQWLYCSGIAFALAFLTKSWHAGNISIIIGMYLLFTGKITNLTKVNWLLLFLCMSAPILAWASVRYQYDGISFFRKMVEYDLLQRSATPIEGHIGGKLYYILVLNRYFKYWLMVLFGLVLFFSYKGSSSRTKITENKSQTLGMCIWIIFPLMFYSFAETKVRWYILPLYIPLSILIGVMSSKLLMGSGKNVTKVILSISIFFSAYIYFEEINVYLDRPFPKLQLSLLQKVQGLDEVKGSSIFLQLNTSQRDWQQNEVLAAELYGDLHVKNGDFNDFIQQKERALLLIQKGPVTKQLIETNHLQILKSNKWGYIVRKK
jgi:4-amino-4-deoxy-L-arabinose transferase-like glycosyltransferase